MAAPTPFPNPRRRAASLARTWVNRVLIAVAGIAVLLEVTLQLPPVRESIRAHAERALAARIRGVTIDRCAAADVTGVVRFDGVHVPLGDRLGARVDGLEVAVSWGSLLAGHPKASRIRAADLALDASLPVAGNLSFRGAGDQALVLAVQPPAEGKPAILTLDGPTELCSGTDGAAQRCLASRSHVELALERGDADDVLTFQLFGDDVRLDGRDGSDDLRLPPLAVNGALARTLVPKTNLQLEASASVGPRGTVAIEGSEQAGKMKLSVDASTDDYPAFVDSLGLGLTQVKTLGVVGPVSAHAGLAGPLSSPGDWDIQLKLDLAALRNRSRDAGAGAALAGGFTWQPAADPDAPPIRMSADDPDFVPMEKMPPLVIGAVLLSEDSEFWTHEGFDGPGLIDALKTDLATKKMKRGGSTVTQQLAKNLWLSREKTIQRKVEEALLTIALEAALPKQRILEIYLNGIEWGPGIYGIRPAARHYFGKEPADLSPKEAAFLATIIPNPRRYYGFYVHGALSAVWERNVEALLEKMREGDVISDAQLLEGETAPLAFANAGAGSSSGPGDWPSDLPDE